jgi:hypothetical protein
MISLRLFAMRHGIETAGNWTHYGGIDCAWTPTAYLPGCAIFRIGDIFHGSQPFGLLGLLLTLIGSISAGFALATLVDAKVRAEKAVLGIYFWRLWFFLAAWSWVLVPIRLSYVYRFAVSF